MILCLGLSLRQASFNVRLARAAATLVREAGAGAEPVALRDLGIPPYDADVEATLGIPAPVHDLAERVRSARGVIIAFPEYNRAMAGVAKNAIDWLSRVRPYVFEGKPALLLSASSGRGAGAAALATSRPILEHVDAVVYAETFGLARAKEAFDEAGVIADPETAVRLRAVIAGWLASLPS
ncbi:MAG: NAD(P)H-dependent oxidoreductase [Candidatus Coatesbacteria bacterium]